MSLQGTIRLSKCRLKYDLDGGLYPDLQSCGLPLASWIELKAPDIGKAGGCAVELLRRFLEVAARLWRWTLKEL